MRNVAKTTTHLTHKFYSDEFLRDWVAMIPAGGRFLQYSYARNRERQSEGKDSQLQCAAERACFYWWRETTLPILNSVSSYEIVRKFGLLRKQSRHVPHDSQAEWVQEQIAKAARFDAFTVSLASQDAWSDVTFSFTIPFAVQGVKATSEEDRKYVSMLMRRIVEAIMKAEKKVNDDPTINNALQKILDKIYFRFNRFARMTMARCYKANYRCDDKELQDTAEFLGAGSNTTADIMEGTINNLQRKTPVMGKKMNNYTKWFGASSATSLNNVPQVATDVDDYVQAAATISTWWRSKRGGSCAEQLDVNSIQQTRFKSHRRSVTSVGSSTSFEQAS